MSYFLQTARLVLWALFGGFFLFFGIQVLIGAYRLKDPFAFVLTFFASNLIILISGVILVAVFFRVWKGRRTKGGEGGVSRAEGNDPD